MTSFGLYCFCCLFPPSLAILLPTVSADWSPAAAAAAAAEFTRRGCPSKCCQLVLSYIILYFQAFEERCILHFSSPVLKSGASVHTHIQVTSRSHPGHIRVTSRSHPGHAINSKICTSRRVLSYQYIKRPYGRVPNQFLSLFT